MSRVSFTPGPWYVAGVDRNNGSIDIKHKFDSVPLEGFIAEVIGGLKEQDANARLIASAPDLLAALEAVSEYLHGIPESAVGGDDEAVRLARIARAALSKARGLQEKQK